MPRLGCQFHWRNHGYGSFDDLLATFSAEKRKKVKRERRRVVEAGVASAACAAMRSRTPSGRIFHRLYEDTFDKRGGMPTLTLPFFREIGRTMGEQLLLVLAEHEGDRHRRRRLLPDGLAQPLRPPLGLLKGLPQPALRGLLLSGPGSLHRARTDSLRARRPGRAQGGARLPADPHLVRALDRRRAISPAHRRLSSTTRSTAWKTTSPRCSNTAPTRRSSLIRRPARTMPYLLAPNDPSASLPGRQRGPDRTGRAARHRRRPRHQALGQRLSPGHLPLVQRRRPHPLVVAGPAHRAGSEATPHLPQPAQVAAQAGSASPWTATSRP
jgi:hypothetical protein